MRQQSRKLTNGILLDELPTVGQEVIVTTTDGAPIVARIEDVSVAGIWFKLDKTQHFAPYWRVWV